MTTGTLKAMASERFKCAIPLRSNFHRLIEVYDASDDQMECMVSILANDHRRIEAYDTSEDQ